jgi:hypothetical protein
MLCDCYTDTIRADFTPDEIKDKESIKAKGGKMASYNLLVGGRKQLVHLFLVLEGP